MANNARLIKEALRKSAPELHTMIDGEWYAGETQIRGAQRALFRRSASGDSAPNMTTQMRKMLRVETNNAKINEFNLNYTPIVIDKEASRLHVDSFDLGDDAANEWLAGRLDASSFDALEGMNYRGSLLDGDSYLIIDPTTVTLKVEPAYDGYNGVSVIYDNAGHVQWACKLWSEGSGEAVFETDSDDESYSSTQAIYIITYYKDKIQSWAGTLNGSEIAPYPYLNDKTETEVTWLLDHLPVIPFVNKKDNYSYFGESEIKPAIPIQNVVNRLLHSTAMVSELGGFPTNIVIGADIDPGAVVPGGWINIVMTDSDGDPLVDYTPEQAQAAGNIRVQQVQAAPLDPYLDALDKFVSQLMQVTQTPIYGINVSGNISGEALKQLEVGLIGKVERFQRENTDAWKEAILLLRDTQETYKTDLGSPPKFDIVAVNWKVAELRDADSEIAALVLMRKDAPNLLPDSFYQKQILSKLGYDEKAVQQIIEEMDAEKVSNVADIFGAGGIEGVVE